MNGCVGIYNYSHILDYIFKYEIAQSFTAIMKINNYYSYIEDAL